MPDLLAESFYVRRADSARFRRMSISLTEWQVISLCFEEENPNDLLFERTYLVDLVSYEK